MDPSCEFCGLVRGVVYCKSDSARLCLRCDNCVHSANYLSRRHERSLLCDKCNSQPAIARCVDDKMSLCQTCEWSGSSGCSGLGHSLQPLSSYSGCPSLAEFSRIWSSVLDVPPSSGGPDAGCHPMIALPCVTNCLEPNEGSGGLITSNLNDLQPCAKFEPWMAPSSVIPPSLDYLPSLSKDRDLLFNQESDLSKGYSNSKNLELHYGEGLCEGLNVDDVALNIEGCDEIFDSLQGYSRCSFEEGGTDQVMEKNASVTESNGHVENALEASSSQQQACMGFQSSSIAGSANMIQVMRNNENSIPVNPSCSRNIDLGFVNGQIHSSLSLSLSNITGESSATDYQDCGLSPMFLMGESPWRSNLEVSCPQARDKAKMRYNEKKKTRMFGKQIRYASRKARADTRKRVKGRFVKAGEACDQDPLM